MCFDFFQVGNIGWWVGSAGSVCHVLAGWWKLGLGFFVTWIYSGALANSAPIWQFLVIMTFDLCFKSWQTSEFRFLAIQQPFLAEASRSEDEFVLWTLVIDYGLRLKKSASRSMRRMELWFIHQTSALQKVCQCLTANRFKQVWFTFRWRTALVFCLEHRSLESPCLVGNCFCYFQFAATATILYPDSWTF